MASVESPKPMIKLAAALGLPRHWQWFTLHCPMEDLVTVECEYIPEPTKFDEGGDAITELAKYELKKKES